MKAISKFEKKKNILLVLINQKQAKKKYNHGKKESMLKFKIYYSKANQYQMKTLIQDLSANVMHLNQNYLI